MAVHHTPVGSALASPPSRTPTRPAQQNVSNVVLGNLRFAPEYPSFYPEELIGGRKAAWLYVCQWCFRYTHELMKYAAHCRVCATKDEPPPGDLIYEKDGYAIYHVDGEEHKLFAQNLSLFAKLFLDTKSVFFDVSSFLYYLLIQRPSSPTPTTTHENAHGQIVGFFSKEKMSWDNNNLACILIFPPWQRKGLGQILMGSSYMLGCREGRFGGPEKPLRLKGRLAYLAYWQAEVCRYVLGGAGKRTVSVKTISEATWILPEDVVAAVREMDVVEGRKTASGSVVISKSRVRLWAERHKVRLEPVVDVAAFVGAEEEDGSEDVESEEIEDSEADEDDEEILGKVH